MPQFCSVWSNGPRVGMGKRESPPARVLSAVPALFDEPDVPRGRVSCRILFRRLVSMT